MCFFSSLLDYMKKSLESSEKINEQNAVIFMLQYVCCLAFPFEAQLIAERKFSSYPHVSRSCGEITKDTTRKKRCSQKSRTET